MQVDAPRVRRKRAYHHGDLRKALVGATVALARRKGVEAITLRAVAEKAGVSAPAAYHHFADKRTLLAAAAGIAFADLDARFEEALSSKSYTAEQRLVALAGAYVRFAIEDPGALRLILGAHVADLDLASAPEAAVPGRRAKARLRAEATAFAADVSTDPEAIFRMVWAHALGTAMLVLEKELDPRGVEAPDATRAIVLAEDGVRRMLASFTA